MDKKPIKMGRPPISKGRRRSNQIMIRTTDSLYNRLRRAAAATGQSVSAVIVDRLEAGPLDESGNMLADLAAALRVVGDWKAKPKQATEFREIALIIINSHLGGRIPKRLYEEPLPDNLSGKDVRRRLQAISILSQRRFDGRSGG